MERTDNGCAESHRLRVNRCELDTVDAGAYDFTVSRATYYPCVFYSVYDVSSPTSRPRIYDKYTSSNFNINILRKIGDQIKEYLVLKISTTNFFSEFL